MDRSIYGKLSAGSKAERHSNIYIHNIVTILKKHAKPVSFKEIEQEAGIDIEGTPGLLELLKKNKKIVREDRTLEYVPTYAISSEEELLSILKETKSEHGISLDEVLDTVENTRPYVDSLISKQRAILLRDMDGSCTLFYNGLDVKRASPEVQRLYDGVSVPDVRDLVRELASAGLSSKGPEKTVRKSVPVQRKKKYLRKIKITNTHLDNKELGM